jgi:hypothetical protein
MRKMIVPGSTNLLRNAVKTAKDVNVSNLPKILFEKNVKVGDDILLDRFAAFFDNNIRDILKDVNITQSIMNQL